MACPEVNADPASPCSECGKLKEDVKRLGDEKQALLKNVKAFKEKAIQTNKLVEFCKNAEKEKAENAAELAKLKSDLGNTAKDRDEAVAELINLREEIIKIREELIVSKQSVSRLAKTESALASTKAEVVKLKDANNHWQRQVIQQKVVIQQSENTLNKLREEHAQKDDQLRKLKDEMCKANELLCQSAEVASKQDAVKVEMDTLRKQLAEARIQAVEAVKLAKSAEERCTILEEGKMSLENQAKVLEKGKLEIETRCKDQLLEISQLRKKDEEIHKLKDMHSEMEARMKAKDAEIQNMRQRVTAAETSGKTEVPRYRKSDQRNDVNEDAATVQQRYDNEMRRMRDRLKEFEAQLQDKEETLRTCNSRLADERARHKDEVRQLRAQLSNASAQAKEPTVQKGIEKHMAPDQSEDGVSRLVRQIDRLRGENASLSKQKMALQELVTEQQVRLSCLKRKLTKVDNDELQSDLEEDYKDRPSKRRATQNSVQTLSEIVPTPRCSPTPTEDELATSLDLGASPITTASRSRAPSIDSISTTSSDRYKTKPLPPSRSSALAAKERDTGGAKAPSMAAKSKAAPSVEKVKRRSRTMSTGSSTSSGASEPVGSSLPPRSNSTQRQPVSRTASGGKRTSLHADSGGKKTSSAGQTTSNAAATASRSTTDSIKASVPPSSISKQARRQSAALEPPTKLQTSDLQFKPADNVISPPQPPCPMESSDRLFPSRQKDLADLMSRKIRKVVPAEKAQKTKPSSPVVSGQGSPVVDDVTFIKDVLLSIDTDSPAALVDFFKNPQSRAASDSYTLQCALDQCWGHFRSHALLIGRVGGITKPSAPPMLRSLQTSEYLPVRERHIILCVFSWAVRYASKKLLDKIMTWIHHTLVTTSATKRSLGRACRMIRAFTTWCRFTNDLQRCRVLCYDLLREVGAVSDCIIMLDNVSKMWPEALRPSDRSDPVFDSFQAIVTALTTDGVGVFDKCELGTLKAGTLTPEDLLTRQMNTVLNDSSIGSNARFSVAFVKSVELCGQQLPWEKRYAVIQQLWAQLNDPDKAPFSLSLISGLARGSMGDFQPLPGVEWFRDQLEKLLSLNDENQEMQEDVAMAVLNLSWGKVSSLRRVWEWANGKTLGGNLTRDLKAVGRIVNR
ncbi:uncharacterized protein SPPG_07929 [Spizellomyces punctatus DAOM BR117]|uniref:Uncharacterized protein n=1 Tax=Spizellomyces punctatus (strain DAOM BR117) TaxID=645134 RepID=A0A0L0H5D7_SPIPD|nr:uncharacterized protein SPPG_07929 [Spizellomyces punctatus DAOM BR117]KNC96720.1 hypothetical protein SPPG_07929 [Spizellomyces punctatus DAOM BR117]|eukprot:XP_016604760.1 hypothetical protein SPPG_07929 [Spizellomyces punctatus DAOM BR117]